MRKSPGSPLMNSPNGSVTSPQPPDRAPDTMAGPAIGRAAGGSPSREVPPDRAPDTMAGSAIGRAAGGSGGSSPREILPEPGGFDAHTHLDILGLPVDGVLDAAR